MASKPDTLDPSALARWGALAVMIALGGLVIAAGAADDYMYACGLLFTGFGTVLGGRLMMRWVP